MPLQQPQKNIDFKAVAIMGTEIGFLIALPLVACIMSGIYIDNKFGLSPWMTIAFTAVGICLTFIDIRYLVIPILEKGQKR